MTPIGMSMDIPKMCFILWTLFGTFLPSALCLQSNGEIQYGVILDAGSSGTKLKVYKWRKPKQVTEVPSMELILRGQKFSPGVGHFAERTADLPKYLSDIVEKAKESVPADMRARSPIYLMATAGARILDANIALGLFNRIRTVLSNATINPFQFKGKNVRILSGEEEAVFAWIAINALSGFFNSSSPPTESLGLLEMGGGSTQIAFVPSEPLYAGEFQVFIGGRRYDLYAHSYLFFGVNYIKQRLRNYLVERNKGASVIHNPCRVIGDDTTSLTKNGTKVTFIGDSNPVGCESILRRFLERAQGDKCHPKPCAIGSVYQPNIGNTSFYATQGFVYTPQTMKSLIGPNKRLNITKLQLEANSYCTKSFSEVKKEYNVKAKYASDECLLGLYFPMLLVDAYQFDSEVTRVTVSNKINNRRIDWTMGAILYELNMMFQSNRLMPLTNISCSPRLNSSDSQPILYTVEPKPVGATGASSVNVAIVETVLLCAAVLTGTIF